MKLRYVVTGARGQLGRCLVRALTAVGSSETLLAGLAREGLDIADRDAVARAFEAWGEAPPDVLVNAAAYNQVDRCESDGAASAMRVNGEGPGILAEHCRAAGTRLVHVSTDYVFAGDAVRPIPEDAATGPRSAYGRSKLAGEGRVQEVAKDAMIVRTSWVFGPGRNFVGAILRQARMRRTGEAEGPLRVVDDQRGCPTYAADLAEAVRALVAGGAPGGVYHWQNAPDPDDDAPPTWWGFARAILDLQGYEDLEIERATTADIAAPAPRPAYSVLSCARAEAVGAERRSWRRALAAYLASPDLRTTLDAIA